MMHAPAEDPGVLVPGRMAPRYRLASGLASAAQPAPVANVGKGALHTWDGAMLVHSKAI